MIDGNFGNISIGVLFSKVVTWKAGHRRSRGLLNILFLNLNDDPDAVLSTDHLPNKTVSILKQNGNNFFRDFCGVKISNVTGDITRNIPEIF